MILATAHDRKKKLKMNYTSDSSYHGHGAADEILHRVVANRGSKQGLRRLLGLHGSPLT